MTLACGGCRRGTPSLSDPLQPLTSTGLATGLVIVGEWRRTSPGRRVRSSMRVHSREVTVGRNASETLTSHHGP